MRWFLFIVLFVISGALLWVSGMIKTCNLLPATCDGPEDMILIPAGEFIMGSDEEDREGKATEIGSRKPWYLDEHPRHKVALAAYFIYRYEVTNAQYKKFVGVSQRRPPPGWE